MILALFILSISIMILIVFDKKTNHEFHELHELLNHMMNLFHSRELVPKLMSTPKRNFATRVELKVCDSSISVVWRNALISTTILS